MGALADNYSAAPGVVIRGGRSAAPADGQSVVAPAPGMLKSIHMNDLRTIDPDPTGTAWYAESNKIDGMWALWNGGVFSPDYGTHGAMFDWGGGHGGYNGTATIGIDCATGLWFRVNDPVPFDFTASLDPEWRDFDYNGSKVIPASHTYCHAVYVPPNRGGGAKGGWLQTCNVYGSPNINPHLTDLDTGLVSRFTNNTLDPPLGGGPYGGAFMDKRGVVWCLTGHDSNSNTKIDTNANPRVATLVTSFYSPGYYFNPCYVASKDIMMAVYTNYSSDVGLVAGYDVSSGTPVPFTVNVASNISFQIPRPGVGFDFCPDTGKFYAYEGRGSTTLHVLTPPAGDWKVGVWTWSTEVMGGEAPVNILDIVDTQGAHPFTKWQYNPFHKCFMWSQGRSERASPDGVMRQGAFQLYRPLGT